MLRGICCLNRECILYRKPIAKAQRDKSRKYYILFCPQDKSGSTAIFNQESKIFIIRSGGGDDEKRFYSGFGVPGNGVMHGLCSKRIFTNRNR